MTSQTEVATLIAQFADLHRQVRIARGYVDSNLEVAVAYACQDMLNQFKRGGASALEILRDEVAYEGECLAKIKAGAN